MGEGIEIVLALEINLLREEEDLHLGEGPVPEEGQDLVGGQGLDEDQGKCYLFFETSGIKYWFALHINIFLSSLFINFNC